MIFVDNETMPKPFHFVSTASRLLLRLLSPIFLLACGASYDWREVKLEDLGLEFQLPCKIEKLSKDLPLLDSAKPLRVTMLGCETGGTVFALSYATVQDEAEAQRMLARWQTAYQASPRLALRASQQGKSAVIQTVLNQDPKWNTAQTKAKDHFFDSPRWLKR